MVFGCASEICPGVLYHRPREDIVELLFAEPDAAIWFDIISKDPPRAKVRVVINCRPIALFNVEDADIINYWTDFYKLREHYANATSRAVFRSILIDLLRPFRPYKEVV